MGKSIKDRLIERYENNQRRLRPTDNPKKYDITEHKKINKDSLSNRIKRIIVNDEFIKNVFYPIIAGLILATLCKILI